MGLAGVRGVAGGGGLLAARAGVGRGEVTMPLQRSILISPDHRPRAAAETGSGRKSGAPRKRPTPLYATEDVAPRTEPDVADHTDAAISSDFFGQPQA